MTRALFLSAILLVAFSTGLQAQDTGSTVRIAAQHRSFPKDMKNHLGEYEVNLLKSLESENPTIQAQAVQTIRDLEQIFPAYPFKSLIAPLGAKLRDEKADIVVRQLSALALDELHSDAGDIIIKEVAAIAGQKEVRSLCTALLVRSEYK